ncbi:MAG: signal peptidase II [Lachnospiraceae bacterium]|nr:signal peptidase II [Lachnospiraceae bacterium]
MNKKTGIIFCCIDLVSIAILFLADRVTKIMARNALMGNDGKELIHGVLELRYLENFGAAFGMLQNFRIFFIVVGAVFLALMLFFLIMIPATGKYRLLRICLCLMSAGAAGNLYDRVTLDYVIDFIYFSCINFPIFNVADCYVTVSTAVLIILLLFVYREEDLDLKKIYGLDRKKTAEETKEKQEEKDG